MGFPSKLNYYLKKYFLSKVFPKYKINYKEKGIINFIDVGSIGCLPEPWLSNANKLSFLVNFEPNDKVRETKSTVTFNYAVWEKEEEREFYIYKGFRGTGSSLYKQNYDYVTKNFNLLKNKGNQKLAKTWFKRSQLKKTVKIQCKTIDKLLLTKFPDKKFDFIKIDAQGAELNILIGAEKILENCLGLHLELYNIPLYKDIPLLQDVVKFLKEKDFSLVKKFDSHGSFNSQNDCLFLKNNLTGEKLETIREVYNLNS